MQRRKVRKRELKTIPNANDYDNDYEIIFGINFLFFLEGGGGGGGT